jgi:hypothetical protein
VKNECAMVDMKLELYVEEMKFNMNLKCFDGWNKVGVTSQIGRMFG